MKDYTYLKSKIWFSADKDVELDKLLQDKEPIREMQL